MGLQNYDDQYFTLCALALLREILTPQRATQFLINTCTSSPHHSPDSARIADLERSSADSSGPHAGSQHSGTRRSAAPDSPCAAIQPVLSWLKCVFLSLHSLSSAAYACKRIINRFATADRPQQHAVSFHQSESRRQRSQQENDAQFGRSGGRGPAGQDCHQRLLDRTAG